tara:strand:- start:30 stop:1109 length:1080 start_codon:yes stop_codon:yes gene_type:complete
MKEEKRSIPYNIQIDGLRCFAVIAVLIFHFSHFENIYLKRLPLGQGVNLFFVISGFLITRILLINKENIRLGKTTLKQVLKAFYIRRSIRIFPIYYITIFYLIIINFQNTREVWPWLVSYTANFYISFDNPYIGSFHHLWSLAVEEQFYLLWPILIFIIPAKHIGKFVVSVIVVSLIFKILYYNYYGPSIGLNAFPISCADSLGFGSLIAFWSLYNPSIIERINKVKYVVLISFIPFVFFIIFPRIYPSIVSIGNNFLFAFFAFFIVVKASQQKFTSITKFLLENRVALHIGKISYGIYLYHFFMPDFYNQMTVFLPKIFYAGSTIKLPFLFASSLIFAQLSWMLIERPILKLKGRFNY